MASFIVHLPIARHDFGHACSQEGTYETHNTLTAVAKPVCGAARSENNQTWSPLTSTAERLELIGENLSAVALLIRR